MSLKSNFKADLKNEKRLSILLDSYYESKLKNYSFKRITGLYQQFKGVDLIFKHKQNGASYYIDEKAQLDYINDDLPTFAFEITYLKSGVEKEGWFFDVSKKTNFYALITAIYKDDSVFSSCKVTLVNREKLQKVLSKKGLNFIKLKSYNSKSCHGKIVVSELDAYSEGYLFYSSKNKIEKPLNLVLKLEWLIRIGVAKRLT